jgi:hypothetical protein
MVWGVKVVKAMYTAMNQELRARAKLLRDQHQAAVDTSQAQAHETEVGPADGADVSLT